jgi:hypothetical protein
MILDNSMTERIIPRNASVGIVIGTFASVPYIHMQLEARKRFYPNIPCLVVDDGSYEYPQLTEICQQYGADFFRNPARLGHVCGDMSSFVHGLLWAKAKNLCLLVKISRRWIMCRPWVEYLQQLAFCTQFPTYSNKCDRWGFGFRSECLAMHVEGWQTALVQLLHGIEIGWRDLAEAWYDQRCSQRIPLCEIAQKIPTPHYGYMVWDILGTNRNTKRKDILWHCSNLPEEYHQLSKSWDLPYELQDFRKV